MADKPKSPAQIHNKDEAILIESATNALGKIADMLESGGYPTDRHPPSKIALKHDIPPFTKKADQRIAAADPGPHPKGSKKGKRKPR